MTTRPCEFCADWTDEYLEKYLTLDWVCGACSGSKVLDIKHCFCCAAEPSECACDADWSDFVYEDDYVYWEDE